MRVILSSCDIRDVTLEKVLQTAPPQ